MYVYPSFSKRENRGEDPSNAAGNLCDGALNKG